MLVGDGLLFSLQRLDDVLTSGLTLSFVFRAGHVDGQANADFRMQTDTDFMQTKRFDGCIQADLLTFDRVASICRRFDDVTCRDRTIKLSGRARLADQNEGLTVKACTCSRGRFACVGIALFKRIAFCFKPGSVLIVCNQRFAFWQKEVACKTVLDADLVPYFTVNGSSASIRARLIALANLRWFLKFTAVIRDGTILPFSEM